MRLKASFLKKHALAIVAITFAISWVWILKQTFPQYDHALLPGLDTTILSAICIALTAVLIKSSAASFLIGLWIAWYYIGCLNTISSSLILRSYYSNLQLNSAGLIHFSGCIACIAGIVIGQLINSKTSHSTSSIHNQFIYRSANPILKWALFIFPITWLLSIRLTVGYLPILLGESIESDIYETNYGFLYSYSFLLCPIAILIYEDYRKKGRTYLAHLLFLSVLLISLVDGKRAIALTAMVAYFGVQLATERNQNKKGLVIGLLISIVAYVLVQIVRSGGDTTHIDADSLGYFMKVGVEYRDFVYTANYVIPGGMAGYDWVSSSLGAFLNGGILKLLGFDKTVLVSSGSAQVWAQFFGSNFGIRTGIISELWFQFGQWYLFVMTIFGIAVQMIVFSLQYQTAAISRSILATIYGLLLLSIVGQSTVLFGVLTLLMYLYVLNILARFAMPRK